MQLDFNVENINEIRFELHPLITDLAEEFGVDLSLNWGMYIELQRLSEYMAFTARHDGELVGYAGFCIAWNTPHVKEESAAVCDVIYLKPAYRKGLNGVRFIRHIEKVLLDHDDGIDTLLIHSRKDISNLRALLGKMGYDEIEVVHMKRRKD